MGPSRDDVRHGVGQAVARARGREGREEQREVVVVEIEHCAAVGVGGVDPLAAAEEPVACVAEIEQRRVGQYGPIFELGELKIMT